MKILIKNARVVDPANNIDGVLDILIDGSRVAKVSKDIQADGAEVIDASGRIVLPGLVDMHVHLREPGREDKETVETGTRAALAGGITSVLAMPNTTPAMDSAENIKFFKSIVARSAKANVFIAGAITKARRGDEVVLVEPLKKEGVLAITDDGSSVDRDDIMLSAMQQAACAGIVVICHCEDKALANQGVMNLGVMSTILGLRGIAAESEYKRVERDIELAKKSKARIHIAHVSCRRSVELIAKAKKDGVVVSAETAPHYFALTDDDLTGYDTNLKMNPPLRSKDDRLAIRNGLRDSTIDVIASDHAPHTENEKEIEFDRAEFGVIGLETELAVAITELINTGILDWSQLVAKLSLNPSRILGIAKGTLGVGSEADIIIVDAQREWKVSAENFKSKSKNSAFIGRQLKGAVEYVILAGKIAYKRMVAA